MAHDLPNEIPIQPIERPIICSPYDQPNFHWLYDTKTGAARKEPDRRPASYWFKTEKTGSAQATLSLFAEEERDDLPLVNLLRDDVSRWRKTDYRGASTVTRELLRHWTREDRPRRLFFCQREAVETVIYLAEMRLSARRAQLSFKPKLSDEDLGRLIRGEMPGPAFGLARNADFFPTLVDKPANAEQRALRRLCCKMATGAGKTVVMAMLIAWAFCNRGTNTESRDYPDTVLICCPNLTVKERLQVLRPENPDNYFAAFDIVPLKYRPLMQKGTVIVTNWHAFAPESEHKEGDKAYAVVNKGPETPEDFAKRILCDAADRGPIMVLNDEGHHAWRPNPSTTRNELDDTEELEEATVWVDGLDRLNAAAGDAPGIGLCVDLSATPFYIKGSGHPEGRPFAWIVSDFGLVDAIESGIVKIPRLPVQDTTGRPDPRYFKLWEAIKQDLQPAELLPGRAKKPKPEVVYREAQGALQQIAGQWLERFNYIQAAAPGQERVPPVLIIVCDNTDIAEVFYRRISGETEIEAVTEAEVEEVLGDNGSEDGEETPKARGRSKKPKTRTVYGRGDIFPDYLSNTPERKYTIRIDSKLLAEAESGDPKKKKKDAAEQLRQVVATVGRPGQPGEHVRCVVSVSMLTEGWDANNVTQVLGIRAFGSQLLCEQVVGRGLRRMDYTPDPATGLLTEEYVDVYGIPFSVIPFKGRPVKKPEPDDKPKNHVRALPERAAMEMRFPVVEGYAFALQKNLIRCDIDRMERLIIEPNREPTGTYVRAQVGYQYGPAAETQSPFGYDEQNREAYYRDTHLQTVLFQASQRIVAELTGEAAQRSADKRQRVLSLQARHQLFPQVFRIVEQFAARKVDFQSTAPAELGLQKYMDRLVERIRDAIQPDTSQGEPPLLPILNRYKQIGTTAEVDFKTTRPCYATVNSHINQVVADTKTWETSAAFKIEQAVQQGVARFYVRNDSLGLVIPYEYMGIDHSYEPDFLVRLAVPEGDITLILEIKGFDDDKTQAKHAAARRCIEAVNNWGKLGKWDFHVCRNPQVLDRELAYIVHQRVMA